MLVGGTVLTDRTVLVNSLTRLYSLTEVRNDTSVS